MLFALHDGKDSDTPGRIHQANKYFGDPDDYRKVLKEQDITEVVESLSVGLLPPEKHWVTNGEIHNRPMMELSIDKTTIKAGGNDFASIIGIPKGAKVVVSTSGMHLWTIEKWESGILEVEIPVPCQYRLDVTLWPYQDLYAVLEAVS